MRPAETDQALQQKIKSGDYYKESLEWYNFIYIYPVAARTFMITVTVFCVLINIIAIYGIYNFMPLKVEVPLAISVEDVGDFYSQVKKLDTENNDVSDAVAKYMLARYVEFREDYGYDNLERDANFVKLFSSSPLYDKYTAYMDLHNAASPVGRLKESGRIAVTNVAVDLPLPEKGKAVVDKNRKATVLFTTRETNGTNVIQNKYRADISFTFSQITVNSKDKSLTPLDFHVEDYIVTPIVTPVLQAKPQ
jgi:type IV secretion system protein VirB8